MTATGIFPKYVLDCRAGATSPALRLAAAPLHPPTAAAPLRAQARVGLPDSAPHVLHVDNDSASAKALAALLTPEARVTHVPTLAAARAILREQIFSVVVIDPNLPDGDGADLLPALAAMPLVVYSATQPQWRGRTGVYLPKPWTSPRRLWSTISMLLGIPTFTPAGG